MRAVLRAVVTPGIHQWHLPTRLAKKVQNRSRFKLASESDKMTAVDRRVGLGFCDLPDGVQEVAGSNPVAPTGSFEPNRHSTSSRTRRLL